MLKILFSPSETKQEGGDFPPINKASFIFPELFPKREAIFLNYQEQIDTLDEEGLEKLFGVKKNKIAPFKKNILKEPTQKAILRYTGVAYDYLDFPSLDTKAQEFIEKNVVIFSNIFGPILSGDKVPNYKFKQGNKLPDINIEKFYKEHFSHKLDAFLAGDILDLRAGFYEKFYLPNKPYYTLKFIKNGKVVSHWAKAYRGIVLKALAKNNITTIDAFFHLNIPDLSLLEIRESKNKKEIIFSIEA